MTKAEIIEALTPYEDDEVICSVARDKKNRIDRILSANEFAEEYRQEHCAEFEATKQWCEEEMRISGEGSDRYKEYEAEYNQCCKMIARIKNRTNQDIITTYQIK